MLYYTCRKERYIGGYMKVIEKIKVMFAGLFSNKNKNLHINKEESLVGSTKANIEFDKNRQPRV